MKKWRAFFLFLAVFTTGLIFFHSSQPADVSNLYSSGVLHFIQQALRALHVPEAFCTNHGVRKAAHFSEFFLQSVLLCTASAWMGVSRCLFFGYVLFIGLFTAVLDENLQVFVPGRSGMVQDVLLDFSGTLSGVGCFFLTAYIWRRFSERNLGLKRGGKLR